MQDVISESGRQALINYKYQSTLAGWLDSNIMTDFWERVVTFIPLFVAPNVITFAATVQFLISTFIFSTYCNDLEKCIEPWLYFMVASSLFIYQTLDAIDGKQARRTKQSSPLGQLFDHGNDALILTPMLICSFCATQAGRTWQFITFMMLAYSVFFMLNWRARHVGMMHFGVFSVTESQFIAIGVQILTGILGCGIWGTKILNIIDGKDAVMGFFLIMGVYTNISEYYAVQTYYKRNPNRRDPGQIHELLHLFLFITASVCWNLVGVLRDYPWTYCWIIGFIFCGMIHRLIVADVTHMKSPKYYHLLNPLIIIIIGSLYEYFNKIDLNNSIMNSDKMVYGILVYVLIFWSAYVIKVIDEICSTLNIRLFIINPPK